MFEYESWRDGLYWWIVFNGIAFFLDITVFADAEEFTRLVAIPALAIYCWFRPPFREPCDRALVGGRLAIMLVIVLGLWVNGVAIYQWHISTAREFPKPICNDDSTDCRQLVTYWGERYTVRADPADGKKQLHIEKNDISMFSAVNWYLRYRHTKRPLDLPICDKYHSKAEQKAEQEAEQKADPKADPKADDEKPDPRCADDKDNG